MKQCPKCSETYDDFLGYQFCLNDRSELVAIRNGRNVRFALVVIVPTTIVLILALIGFSLIFSTGLPKNQPANFVEKTKQVGAAEPPVTPTIKIRGDSRISNRETDDVANQTKKEQ